MDFCFVLLRTQTAFCLVKSLRLLSLPSGILLSMASKKVPTYGEHYRTEKLKEWPETESVAFMEVKEHGVLGYKSFG